MKQLHFISGLPRAGSTLLAAVLRQNPRCHAAMSSPLAGLFSTLLSQMSQHNEYAVFIDDDQRRRMLRGLFENYYADHAAELVFDTNRAWCAHLPALVHLFGDAKIIACVRQLPWIIDSIERLVQRNAFNPSSLFGYTAGGTVFTRASTVAGPDGMVGYALDALKQACYGPHADRLLLLQYETLTSAPAAAMQAVYDFLGEPAFEHDFEQVEYGASLFDQHVGTPGLHTVHGPVQAVPRDTLLPPELFRRFAGDAFWRDSKRIPKGLRII